MGPRERDRIFDFTKMVEVPGIIFVGVMSWDISAGHV